MPACIGEVDPSQRRDVWNFFLLKLELDGYIDEIACTVEYSFSVRTY